MKYTYGASRIHTEKAAAAAATFCLYATQLIELLHSRSSSEFVATTDYPPFPPIPTPLHEN